jgi:predicted phosphodiesterase
VKVAILADVHGNAAALEAVIADLETVRPDRVLVNGDLLAFGPEPEETAALLRRLGAPSTRGNTDRWLVEVALGEASGVPEGDVRDSLGWTVERMPATELRALRELPFSLSADPLPVVLYHASAAGDDEGVWPTTPDGDVPGLFAGAPHATLVVSHTHRAGERRAGGVRVLNTGSVGLPYDGDPRAAYLVLQGDDAGGRGADVHAEWRRVEYDRERTLGALRDRAVPMAARLALRIRTGEY